MDLYNQEINEFVNWVTGHDSITNSNVTNNLPVSGEQIRNLLSNRLQNPFYLYLDTTDSLYKIFSSKEAFEIWKTGKEQYAYLVKHTFQGPAQYTVSVETIGVTQYVKRSDNTVVPFSFKWDILDTNKNAQPSGVSVDITIKNAQNIQTGSLPKFNFSSDRNMYTVENLYPYLNEGMNQVTVKVTASDNDISGIFGSVTATIYVVDMKLTSNFNNFTSITAGSNVSVVTDLAKSLSGAVRIYGYLDGVEIANKQASGTGNISSNLSFVCPYAETNHRLILYAVMTDPTNTYTIYSNVLYYDFMTSITDSSHTQRYLLIANSFNANTEDEINSIKEGNYAFNTTQYEQFTLDWGYYNVAPGSADIIWKLENNSESIQILKSSTASNSQGTQIQYITEKGGEYQLNGYIGSVKTFSKDIYIAKGLDIEETSGYEIKLSAYGKSNETDRTWNYNQYSTTFSPSVNFTQTNGWYDNSLRLSGEDNYATINFNPFAHKAQDGSFTFEIDFYTEYVSSNDDVLVSIGDRFKIYPNKACLYNTQGEEIIKTNFKSNERLKLAFIVNGDDIKNSSHPEDANLAFIVNNGVLERGANVKGVNFTLTNGEIKIGGSNSGIRVYNIRHYKMPLTYSQAYDDYVFDAIDKSAIVSKNNVLNTDGKIDSELCANKLDVVIIEGDLSKLLDANTSKEDSNTTATITRRCNYDITKNFTITNGKIRKHGQSTLNYPIPSFKIWSNSSTLEGVTPELDWAYNPGYGKNRYTMKDSSIPANKWILQANYADSSGVHNGGLQRLIQNTWYNATITQGTKQEYKLRTPPQLFASGETISSLDGSTTGLINGYNEQQKRLKDYSNYRTAEFPYDIEVAPDSFPCVVFYKNTASGDTDYIFLGQYVFMEDKKSDFCYGERSMYNVANDPFCLLAANNKQDTTENKMWNNNHVLRMEVLTVDSVFSSYKSRTQAGLGFEDIIYDTKNPTVPLMYNWENDFELIYPDPDDLETDATKFAAGSKFNLTVKPFIDWYKWLQDCREGKQNFKQTAAQHLDLYKIAAYYIFCMRFGLVDSMERNAQIKTYDGQHFWYEPWDMDIALGNRNTGGIAFDPPVDRTTVEAGSTDKFALSGHDNYLWNQLEGWDQWINDIVPSVASALYTAGLSYDKITAMFDDNYQNKWCEIIYNRSGHFKYVEQNSGEGASDFLAWLQGSRTTHRHWWLKASMDYWDAKWACGDFRNHSIYVATTKAEGKEAVVTIKSSTKTYFNYALNYNMQELKEASGDQVITYDITSKSISPKVPFSLYGTLYAKELDLSCMAAGMTVVRLGGAHSDETGSNLIKLNIGNKISNNKLTINNTQLSIQDLDKLIALEDLDISGQHNLMNTAFTSPIKLKTLHAAASNLSAFYSSNTGNQFDTLELPDSIATFEARDSKWNTLKFYSLTLGDVVNGTDDDGKPYQYYDDSTITETNDLSRIEQLTLLGTTGHEECAKELVFKWIDSITQADGSIPYHYGITMNDIYWENVTYAQITKLAKLYAGNTLKGYIRLAASETLTNDQLLQLVAWFGDSVFVLNGGGLTIDYALNTTQIVLGTPATSENNQFYVNENKASAETGYVTVRLRYVKFMLQETDSEATWSVRGDGSVQYSNQYKGCEIISQESEYDGSKTWYLKVSESSYGNYTVDLKVDVDGNSYETSVHIIGVTYPGVVNIDLLENTSVMYDGGKYIFQGIGANGIFGVSYDKPFNAHIKEVKWTVYNSHNAIVGDDDPFMRFTNVDDKLKGSCINVENTSINYTCLMTVIFKSNYVMTKSTVFNVFNDFLLVNSNVPYLFSVLQNYDSSRQQYFRSNVESITNLTFPDADAFTFIGLGLVDIQEYLIALTNVDFSNNTKIKLNGDNELRVSAMPQLQVLNISGCTGLVGTLDLSENVKIRNIDARSTTVNLQLPSNNVINTLHYGSPSIVDIQDGSLLTTFDIQSGINLTQITLNSLATNKQFAIIAEIYNTQLNS